MKLSMLLVTIQDQKCNRDDSGKRIDDKIILVKNR